MFCEDIVAGHAFENEYVSCEQITFEYWDSTWLFKFTTGQQISNGDIISTKERLFVTIQPDMFNLVQAVDHSVMEPRDCFLINRCLE